jgi:NADH-quinone oxidoreductase subunit G/[NiFe] hydrogenase diaphorase moiety small subunit/NADP-reducing hydrogenase subunit HndD
LVEIAGNKNLVASCAMPVAKDMEVFTTSLKVRNARKHIISLLLTEHDEECTKCYKNGKCELQKLAAEHNIGEEIFIDLVPEKKFTIDNHSPSIIKNDSKCVRCQRCVRTCEGLQHVSAIGVAYKGHQMKISTFFEHSMFDVVCTNCGQCVIRCPTGALVEKNYIDEVWEAIFDKTKHVVVQTAPAVRVALGEELGYSPGTRVTGKMVSALKRLGFDSVLDTDFSADLTIMEEGYELLQRLQELILNHNTQVHLPLITSCSPGWIKFIEHTFPEYLGNVSTCKSPQQMFGALAKTYYAKKKKLTPANIVSVSIMPCVAKKFEANRPEMKSSGYQDVDYVLTTRELAMMIRQVGLDFHSMPDSDYDSIMGKSTGAGVIFGATGGVMEAALRTVYEIITGREIPFDKLNIIPVRGMEGLKEAELKVEGTLPEWSFLEGVVLKTAIAHGLVNAKHIMQRMKEGLADYHFIEVMACPGGCLGGGGQPIPTNAQIRKKRTEAIYAEDMGMPLRKSHENPDVQKLYLEFLTEPLSEKAHELLHTHYKARSRY